MDKSQKPVSISRSLILEHLHDSENAYDVEQREVASCAAIVEHAEGIDRLASDAEIEDMQSWLKKECNKEQARAVALEPDSGRQTAIACQYLTCRLKSTSPGINTTITGHARHGEGTSDYVPEDLLAPLRLRVERSSGRESYSEMLDVLLAWNAHVVNSRRPTPGARQQLLDTLKARSAAAKRVLDITQDKAGSKMYDEIGQEAILEPSERALVKALHTYRPETTQFANQNPFSMLIMLWANIGRADPDIRGDHDLRDATLVVLGYEAQLVRRFLNAEIRWSVVDSKDVAKRKRDRVEVIRCKEQLDNFDRDVERSSVSKTMKDIACARGELRKIIMKEMLELAVLQAALEWAVWEAEDRAPASAWNDVLQKCAEADEVFEKARELCLDDLDMTMGVMSTTLEGMRTVYDSTLTRAMKIAGEDVAKMDEATRKRIVDQRKREPVTALTMSETVNGVKEAQRAAMEMLRHVYSMEHSLFRLLEVAKSRYRAYDEFVALLPPGEIGEEKRLGGLDI
ncbi:hypothetical protein NX059_012528 [Plenodomus lindquistii]|nr:hypothetical protein NX059_012528 [Plenodomus lindquistii]